MLQCFRKYSRLSQIKILGSAEIQNKHMSQVTFNSKSNLLQASIAQDLFGYITVFNVLEKAIHLCTVYNCKRISIMLFIYLSFNNCSTIFTNIASISSK